MRITRLETRIVGLGFRNCIVVQLHLELHARMATDALRPEEGYFELPTAAGLGVEPIEGCEQELPYKAFEGWR